MGKKEKKLRFAKKKLRKGGEGAVHASFLGRKNEKKKE